MRGKDATSKKVQTMKPKSNIAGHLIRIALFALIFTACLILSFYVLPN